MSSRTYGVPEILTWTGGKLANGSVLGSGVESIRVRKIAPIQGAQTEDIVFFFSKEYQDQIPHTCPGILVTAPPFAGPLEGSGLPIWKKVAVIVCNDPYLALARVSEHLASGLSTVAHLPGETAVQEKKVHPTAIIDPQAEVGPNVRIGAYCVIEAGAKIGAGCTLYPHCYIGPHATLGDNVVLFPRVTLYEKVSIGDRVRIHAGTTIGADGFGYAPVKENGKVVSHQKIYHFGGVRIGDDVEIGANACIDRGTLLDTIIEKGAKLDDDVMVGHNCHIEEGAVICGATGLAGSASVGKFAYVGGLVGINNKAHIGERANVGGCSLVYGDVEPGVTVSGHPVRKHPEYFQLHVLLTRLLKEHKAKKRESSKNV